MSNQIQLPNSQKVESDHKDLIEKLAAIPVVHAPREVIVFLETRCNCGSSSVDKVRLLVSGDSSIQGGAHVTNLNDDSILDIMGIV